MSETESDNAPDGPVMVVGIGASAGGLEALGKLVGTLEPDWPLAYVVLQHLSPDHRSMLVDILSRDTALAVQEMVDGDTPRPGTVYVVPARSKALIREGRFRLVNADPEVVPKPSVNEFFISLAAEAGESAIGVVLSGTGSDGTAGLRAIQAAGGLTLAQAPDSAKYTGMPLSAIEAGVADHVLAPVELGQRLGAFARMRPPGRDELPAELMERLVERVRRRRDIDFSGYKPSTLARRIRRRMVATGNTDVRRYADWVEAHPEELDRLARDILISVTAFFRDPEAFDALAETVRGICREKGEAGSIRVWVAGCATGEEAYSIGILFAEAQREQGLGQTIQVFATDIDEDALDTARRGLYPAAALQALPPDCIERYFHPADRHYEVGKRLRDMIVFARHNLVDDPPFLRTDLITCRNVLIYFDARLQARVLQRFHFALNRRGHLFLGRSEGIGQGESLFEVADRRERLFRKRGDSRDLPPVSSTPARGGVVRRRADSLEQLLEALAARFGATAALCDTDGNQPRRLAGPRAGCDPRRAAAGRARRSPAGAGRPARQPAGAGNGPGRPSR